MEPSPARRTIRYEGYDYSMAGYYALTLCAAGKAHLFGYLPVPETETSLLLPLVVSKLGALVQEELLALPTYFPIISLDEYVLMPNHLHVILVIRKNGIVTISQVIGAFKSRCYRAWRQALLHAREPAPATCWQRNYYEHIIRNASELDACRRYIQQNPARWHGL